MGESCLAVYLESRAAVTSPRILSSDQLKCDYRLLTVVGIGMETRMGGESPAGSS